MGSDEIHTGHSPHWKRHRRRRRRIVPPRGVRYAQWAVVLMAAILLGRLVWQGMYPVFHPLRAHALAPAANRDANSSSTAGVPWQRDVLSSIEDSRVAAQAGNITAAEVAADRASAIITAARMQSQPATPDFFSTVLKSLDMVLQQHPVNERLLEHVTDTRIELAQLRTSQNAPPAGFSAAVPFLQPTPPPDNSARLGGAAANPTPNSGPKHQVTGQGSVAAADRTPTRHVVISAPREIAAHSTLDPKALGGNFLDASLMPDSSEVLLPPASRLVSDDIRVANLTIAGAAQTLDNMHWENVTFVGTRLRFEGGSIDLQNVRFVHCTFGFPSDARGAQLANAIALGQSSITIE